MTFFIEISESARGLAKHIPKVARAIVKVLARADDLNSVADYMKVLGKIHSQNGIQVSTYLSIHPIHKKIET